MNTNKTRKLMALLFVCAFLAFSLWPDRWVWIWFGAVPLPVPVPTNLEASLDKALQLLCWFSA